MLRGESDARFGPRRLYEEVMSSGSPSLRFELGLGDARIDRFLTAHERAMRVLVDLFEGARELHLVAKEYVDPEESVARSLLRVFRGLKDCALPLAKRGGIWTTPSHLEEGGRWVFAATPIDRDALPRAVWAAVSGDMRIEPTQPALIYLLSAELGVLAHPYDDRGMDVMAPNRERLKRIYDKHNSLLLDYDRERLDRDFA